MKLTIELFGGTVKWVANNIKISGTPYVSPRDANWKDRVWSAPPNNNNAELDNIEVQLRLLADQITKTEADYNKAVIEADKYPQTYYSVSGNFIYSNSDYSIEDGMAFCFGLGMQGSSTVKVHKPLTKITNGRYSEICDYLGYESDNDGYKINAFK